jgi:hypothetical protein
MQILGFLTGLLVFAATFVLGFFLLAGILGLVLIFGLVVYLRMWWLRRKMVAGAQEDHVLEGEYRVVDRESGNAEPGERR